MSKPLIIVESPTKAKTISKFLKGAFDVEASFGHVRDLPKSKMGIDIEHGFVPTYTIPTKAKETIKNLKAKVKGAPEIILATDEDREGEAISWHLVQALGLGDEAEIEKGKTDNRIKRIVFHEITQTAIDHALANPRKIDLNLVDAQQARRILDRLVGYELSPFLWRKVRYGLSAGRVQSVAVRLVVEREREIQGFKTDEYWSIEAQLSKQKKSQTFIAKLTRHGDKSVGKMDIHNETEAKKITAALEGAEYSVVEITKKEVKRNPSPPFTTSTLQQEAARKFGMSAKQTMVIAQQLYETGYITYMRTDSVNLAQSALVQAKAVIAEDFGNEYTLTEPRFFSNKSKGAQEAHEAIRPADLSLKPASIKTDLDRTQHRLYDIIWKRTLASQMQQAIMDHTSADIDAVGKTGNFTFRANGQIIKFDGFIRAYTEGTDEKPEDEVEGALPELSKNEKLDLHELSPLQHFTEPPARYTDATLIKALEAHGIGRPSTYAPTLSTIQDRDYVEKEDKKYKPTEVGVLVNDLLVENFPEIVDINFTSDVEKQFDDIAEGELKWVPVIENFYTPFKKHLIEKEASVQKQIEVSTTPCPHCSKMMIIKFGRMGKFLACPDPESKVTKPMPEEEAKIKELEVKTKGEICPICSGAMHVKRGRFGYFLGCANYPKCKGISKIWNKLGFKCPNCLAKQEGEHGRTPNDSSPSARSTIAQGGEPSRTASSGRPVGELVEKKSRGRGKPFYACTKYPDCTFIMNKKPESQEELLEQFKVWKEAPTRAGQAEGAASAPPRRSRSKAEAFASKPDHSRLPKEPKKKRVYKSR